MIIREFAIDSVSRQVKKILRNQIHTIFCANVSPLPSLSKHVGKL